MQALRKEHLGEKNVVKFGIKFLERLWSEGLELEFEVQRFMNSLKRYEGVVRRMGT